VWIAISVIFFVMLVVLGWSPARLVMALIGFR
jgi:hypothetical protein